MAPPVIITGMHRSGTSLLASMLQRAGLHVGDQVLGPGPGNPRGYFEDAEFVEFHDVLLAELGTTMYLETEPRGEIPTQFRERAASMVSTRATHPAWGWKDPRTALFLDFWREVAPDARFVFTYRRPAEVVDSLRRRGDVRFQRTYPGAATLARLGVPRFVPGPAVELWKAYNTRLAEFAERHRDACDLVRVDTFAEAIGPLVDTLCHAGVPLRGDADPAAAIEPGLTVTRPSPSIDRYCRHDRQATTLMRRLDALICSPGGAEP